MRHAGDPDELPEVTCHELRSIVGDDPRFHFRISFVRAAAQSRFRASVMDEESAVAIQHAAQIVERAADVDIGNIDVPVLVLTGGNDEW